LPPQVRRVQRRLQADGELSETSLRANASHQRLPRKTMS
jgi:hypothetical protein